MCFVGNSMGLGCCLPTMHSSNNTRGFIVARVVGPSFGLGFKSKPQVGSWLA